MSVEQKITTNRKVPNNDLETLRKYFPHCFDKNGNFQLEKFTQNLTEKKINFSSESYGMDWLGKSYARLLASDPLSTLLQANETHNQQIENLNSENLLIKGDNLEVLKHLANAYYEKIKMIYIDPPYNTGNDGFVYEDDRKFTVKELRNLIGVDEEKAKRILEFTKTKSNSHSAWLTFMYPRLYIAKQLLKDDGVIFISIDDNEVAQLRLLMDEVFGEENFVGEIVWQTATDNNPTQIATEHEYVLVYVKNSSFQGFWEIPSEKGKIIQKKYEELKTQYKNSIEQIQNELRKWIRKQTNGDDLSGISHYSYVDEKGVYYPGNSANTKQGGYTYDIIHPVTKKVCAKPEYGYRYTFETFKKADDNGDVQWGENEKTIPKIKKRLDTVTEKLKSYYYEDNRTTSAQLKSLFDDKKIFNNPKSVNFLKRIIKFILNPNDLILDFFAGSGTTGDAVMQLNAEVGGNRKFILVQIPEEIDPKKSKVAYDFVESLVLNDKILVEDTDKLKTKNSNLKTDITIFEITKERLIRAGKKINEKLDEINKNSELKIKNLQGEIQTEKTTVAIKDLETEITKNLALKTKNYFKVFETMPIWEDYDFEADELNNQIALFDESKLTEDDLKALLVTWKTYDGISLTQDLESLVLSDESLIADTDQPKTNNSKLKTKNYIAHYGSNRLYLMNKGFTTDNLKNLLEKIDADKNFNPTSVVVFGYHFDSKNLRELSESLKNFANKKHTDIDFITRY
jgi:adenine-specific DNA-methyltransferase